MNVTGLLGLVGLTNSSTTATLFSVRARIIICHCCDFLWGRCKFWILTFYNI